MKNIPFDSWTKTIKYGFITIRDHWPIQAPSPTTSPHQSPLHINLILRVKKWKIDNNVVFFFQFFFFYHYFFQHWQVGIYVFLLFLSPCIIFSNCTPQRYSYSYILYTYRSNSMYNTIIWKKVWGLFPFSIFFCRITFEKCLLLIFIIFMAYQ